MATDVPRLIILIDSSQFGGIETHVLELATLLTDHVDLEVVFSQQLRSAPFRACIYAATDSLSQTGWTLA